MLIYHLLKPYFISLWFWKVKVSEEEQSIIKGCNTHIISEKIMGGDRSVSLWEVKIPIKGSISFAKDGLEIDNVKFHLEKEGVLAKIVVESTPEDMENEAIKYVNRVLDKIAFETGASCAVKNCKNKRNKDIQHNS